MNTEPVCCHCGRAFKELIPSEVDDSLWCVDCADYYAELRADDEWDDSDSRYEYRRDNGIQS